MTGKAPRIMPAVLTRNKFLERRPRNRRCVILLMRVAAPPAIAMDIKNMKKPAIKEIAEMILLAINERTDAETSPII